MTQPLLSYKNVSKKYNQRLVLKNINLSVEAGMVIGLLGKNGAGKTTLLRSALGLINPDQGEVNVLGELSHQLSASNKEKIGYVAQQTFGYEGFKIADALALHRSFYPNWDMQLEAKWLARFELNSNSAVNDLSIGQRQTLALIMAMAYRPQLLILDEPVASLDPIARREFMSDLFDLALDSGSGILFSSHITSDIERVASHIALIKQGELLLLDELDVIRDTVRKINFKASTIDLSAYKVLNQQQNCAIIYGYTGEVIPDALAINTLSLEQLFVELHG
ncbi:MULTISPECIES: ABC transporter ATP-binding protein [unclassified Pseudoalteromonas]|uniref:ABC transporter ATP-binding protein n=1 Tax=unclassified Pseudoalteromonas TaxID=194690 RepID=UPI000B3C8D12|nr:MULTISPECIES: ABC transporter ATP-binding protein [unclassified Pseudoalteromonas]MDN3376840.1 ABC transporter ATP-binding protein [Pseudoalteromonas sp. APC 3893]MDN3387450.1 ABC transporter ATP-binding protein [Pseudoalteromonas sp. APC 4017]OUS71982.1 ABC transporter [Pseudoalteromonas sp. A601]